MTGERIRRRRDRPAAPSLSWALLLAVLLVTVPSPGPDLARTAGTTGQGTTSGQDATTGQGATSSGQGTMSGGSAGQGTTSGDSTCAASTGQVVMEEPWPQDRLGLRALGQQYRGWGITVAVLSSGISADHPQLHGRVLDGISIDDAGPANTDCLGFGTAIAGAAAAAPVSGTPLVGIAPQSSVLPVRLPDWVVHPSAQLDDQHRLQASLLLARAITAALPSNPQVMVLPSASVPDSTQLRAAVAAAEERGCLLIEGAPATAGQGDDYPAGYPEVLVVEGDSAEGDDVPTALAADRIDLIAPGMQVPVLTPGRGHQLVTSTTVSAGFVAGAAALVIEALHPRSAAEVRTRLRRSTVPSVHGGIPVLDPATALNPTGTVGRDAPGGTLGRLLTGRPEPDRASIAALAVAVAVLVALGLVLFAGAAAYRGRLRDWRPAGRPPAPAAVENQLPLTDDPFRPPGRYGAWWLARNLDGDAAPDSPAGRRTHGAPPADPADASAHGGQP